MEKILEINEVFNVKVDNSWSNQDGFCIKTDQQEIMLLIDNGQNCCESWGYFMSEENLGDFIGSEILNISITDSALNTKLYKEHVGDYGADAGDVMFVNIETTNGLLQFAAYNVHNGYYGHGAYVFSNQLKHETNL
jgi:hypothetical protein